MALHPCIMIVDNFFDLYPGTERKNNYHLNRHSLYCNSFRLGGRISRSDCGVDGGQKARQCKCRSLGRCPKSHGGGARIQEKSIWTVNIKSRRLDGNRGKWLRKMQRNTYHLTVAGFPCRTATRLWRVNGVLYFSDDNGLDQEVNFISCSSSRYEGFLITVVLRIQKIPKQEKALASIILDLLQIIYNIDYQKRYSDCLILWRWDLHVPI